jgi:GT2 family glycosyltransferase
MYPLRFGIEGIGPYHLYWQWPRGTAVSAQPEDFQIVTGACLLTPRELFLELGGFDEIYWNGYEDVDYCLRVGERGLRVVYEPAATLYHYESQSGVQRKRRVLHNLKTLGNRWGNRIVPDHNRYWARGGMLRRDTLVDGRFVLAGAALPPITVVVHGDAPLDPQAFAASVRANRLAITRLVWLAAGDAPSSCEAAPPDTTPMRALRTLLEERADRYLGFVSTATTLGAGWLDDLANGIEYGSEVMAATIDADEGATLSPCAADARCSLLNLRDLPIHVRIGDVDTLDGAIVDLTWQAVRRGLGVRAVRSPRVALGAAVPDAAFAARYAIEPDRLRRPDVERFETACADGEAAPTFASIVMLSWNAPAYTKIAVESIRASSHSPYEIIIIDNGSGPETLAMLAALPNVRVVYNATNLGFAHGCNQGIAAARGTHVVLLNNDVVVTEGWLESLLDAHRRDPLVGVSAPRSNRIVGHQQLDTVNYDSNETMVAFAARRRGDFGGSHYRTNRAIGFCLCIARAVIDEIGGIDTRYGIGNFEDDDFCIRVRAAGYVIAVCEDAFIHHFGSVSFAANKVDYGGQMQRNWQIFAERWGLPAEYPTQGYNAGPAISRGFSRAAHYVALPAASEPAARAHEAPERSYDTAFVAVVDGEAAWSRVGPVVTNYLKTLSNADSAVFAIGVTGSADAATIGARIAKSIDRMELDEGRVADIDVADIELAELDAWLAAIPAAVCLRVAKDERLAALGYVGDRSPSGLLRTVAGGKR